MLHSLRIAVMGIAPFSLGWAPPPTDVEAKELAALGAEKRSMLDVPASAIKMARADVLVAAPLAKVRDAVYILGSSGNGVLVGGNDLRVLGNHVSYVDLSGTYNAPIRIESSGSYTIKWNTLESTARDGIMFLGKPWEPLQNTLVQFNELRGYGLMQDDLGGFYVGGDRVDGQVWAPGATQGTYSTTIDHNWFHDGHDRGIQLDMNAHGFVIHHNVFWNTQGVELCCQTSYAETINSNTFGPGASVTLAGVNAGGLAGGWASYNVFTSASQIRTGCSSGVCVGASDHGMGGLANFYGGYGFGELFHPNNPGAPRRAGIWTDNAFGVNDWAPSGAFSYGAYNYGGFDWRPGADPGAYVGTSTNAAPYGTTWWL